MLTDARWVITSEITAEEDAMIKTMNLKREGFGGH
jgi:hypothetical protein